MGFLSNNKHTYFFASLLLESKRGQGIHAYVYGVKEIKDQKVASKWNYYPYTSQRHRE